MLLIDRRYTPDMTDMERTFLMKAFNVLNSVVTKGYVNSNKHFVVLS